MAVVRPWEDGKHWREARALAPTRLDKGAVKYRGKTMEAAQVDKYATGYGRAVEYDNYTKGMANFLGLPTINPERAAAWQEARDAAKDSWLGEFSTADRRKLNARKWKDGMLRAFGLEGR